MSVTQAPHSLNLLSRLTYHDVLALKNNFSKKAVKNTNYVTQQSVWILHFF